MQASLKNIKLKFEDQNTKILQWKLMLHKLNAKPYFELALYKIGLGFDKAFCMTYFESPTNTQPLFAET